MSLQFSSYSKNAQLHESSLEVVPHKYMMYVLRYIRRETRQMTDKIFSAEKEANLNGGHKFADFVSEKGCKSQGCKNEDSTLYMFEEATRIYQKCNIF